jgi:hypothetical protein
MTFPQDPSAGQNAVSRFQAAYILLFVLSALNAAVGVYAWSSPPAATVRRMLGDGRMMIAAAVILVVLGVMARRKSVAALVIGFVLVVANMIFNLVRHFNPGSIIFGSLFAYVLWNGVVGLREMKKS